jgi:hypothetical protein
VLLKPIPMVDKKKAMNKKHVAPYSTSPTESLDEVAKRVIAHIQALRDVDIV